MSAAVYGRLRGWIGLVGIVIGLAGTAAFGASPAIANDPPVCPDQSHTVATGQPLEVQGACTDADGPNSQLTYSIVSGPSGGTLSIQSLDTAIYRSFIGFVGNDSFTYQAHDGAASSNTATVNIEVTGTASGNQPPECPTTNMFAPSDGHVDVSGNCSDPDGDPISYGITSSPSGGSLQILSASSVRYTPDPGTTSDSFVYSATDGFHATIPVTVNITVTDPGTNTFETAPEATDAQPYVASVTTTQAGGVAIDARQVTATPPTGFFLLNQEFDISAPDALSANDPLRLTFTIDESQVPVDPVVVFRNGDPVADCSGEPGVADPNPCVAENAVRGDGDLVITVLTTQASVWNFGVSAVPPAAYEFSGFFPPVNNRPTLNAAKAGSAVPVKFSLGGDQGLDVLGADHPKSEQIDCSEAGDVDGLESTANPGGSGLSYDASSDTYTYVWQTSRDWANTCRQLILKFNDPGQTARRANFKLR